MKCNTMNKYTTIATYGYFDRFKQFNDIYTKMGLLTGHNVYYDEFIRLCNIKLTPNESENSTLLYNDYYYKMRFNQTEPTQLFSGKIANKCFYAKKMTYIVASRISTIPITLSDDLYKTKVIMCLFNYSKFCNEFLSDIPQCKGSYLEKNNYDSIIDDLIKLKQMKNEWLSII